MSTEPTAGNEPSDRSLQASQDRDLVERIVQRDTEALAALYDRFSPLLFALARRVLKDSQDAEEILQEVFLQAWNQASRYQDTRSSVSTWLVMLTRSRSIDRLRSRQSRERTLASLKEEKPKDYASAEAAGNVFVGERRKRILSEMKELPKEQRLVIELAFYRGLSQSEIANSTGIPLGTVKTRTLLAMKKLRKALGSEMKDLL
ncbi:MAG: sigma-70 family RNA polymerase sigma factor [Deltaproteobacteria bacterium]|nr:sigma-70 family RNA polymerase sigma factor [Deltaproteobacteria bacterium]